MSASIYAKDNGTQAAFQVNGVDSVVFDVGGTVSGVRKSSVTEMPTLGTSKPTTSGTSVEFTDIPSWVNEVTFMWHLGSTSGTSPYLIQLGSTTFQTTGYNSSGMIASGGGMNTLGSTAGFVLTQATAAANSVSGFATFKHMGGNVWVGTGSFALNASASNGFSAGGVTLSGALDRIRLTTVNGTDPLDAGTANISYS